MNFLLKIILMLLSMQTNLFLQFSLSYNQMKEDITINYDTIFTKTYYNLPTLSLCFGTPNNQCFNMVININSPATILENPSAYSLYFKTHYQKKKSSTLAEAKEVFGFTIFDNNFVIGDLMKDKVSISPLVKASETLFYFFFVESRISLRFRFPFDGFIGFQKKSNFYKENRLSLLQFFFNTNQITRMSFALTYDDNGGGMIYFDEMNDSYDKCKSYDNFNWSCEIKNITIGGKEYIDINSIAYFDSIKSVSIVPMKYGQILFDGLIEISNQKCYSISELKNKVLICKEGTDIDRFPDLVIQFEGNQLIMKWKSIFRLKENSNGERVYLSSLISDSSNNNKGEWILGVTVFKDNLVIFDIDDGSTGFINKQLRSFKNKKSYYRLLFFNSLIIILGIGITNLLYCVFILK